IDGVFFPAKPAAKGQPDPACGQIKQVGGINGQVQCRELRGKQISCEVRREINQWGIAWERHTEVSEWIERGRLSDKGRRGGIKERVGPVQDLLKARTIDAPNLRNLLDLAVHEPRIVTPGSVKKLVAFHTDRETLGDVFVIDETVAEIGKACASAARDDLFKRIKWVKGAKRQSNLRTSRGVWRGNCNAIG